MSAFETLDACARRFAKPAAFLAFNADALFLFAGWVGLPLKFVLAIPELKESVNPVYLKLVFKILKLRARDIVPQKGSKRNLYV